MLCALSGQTIVEPVVSPVSGRVFERSTIEAYIDEKGVDPITRKPLTREQLIAIDVVPPNPELVKSTSIPGLLKALQTEFNALVVENHELTENLVKSQREVEAALRIISKLKAEQDNTGPPLKRQKPNVLRSPSTPSIPSMPSMEGAMNLHFLDIQKTQEELNAKRKEINKLAGGGSAGDSDVEVKMLTVPRNASPSLHILGDRALLPGVLVDLHTGSEQKLKGQVYWVNESTLCLSSGKQLQLLNTALEQLANASVAIPEKIRDVLPHPAGFLLVRTAKFVVLLELFGLKPVKQLELSCHSLAIHPDGELIFVSSAGSGLIMAYSLPKLLAEGVSANAVFAELPASGKNITALTPSPNGFLLAYIIDGVSIGVLDLRYEDPPHIFEKIGQPRAPIRTLAFDEFGMRLLVSGGKLGAHILSFSPTSGNWSMQKLSQPSVRAAQWHKDKVIAI